MLDNCYQLLNNVYVALKSYIYRGIVIVIP